MGITFVHLSLLALGSLFVAVPVLLHLAMRQKPKHQLFPALRFLQQRQTVNRRRLQLRQWLLLLLRCLLVLILAAALARPSVASSQWLGWLTIGMLGLLLVLVLLLTALTALQRRGVLPLVMLSLLGLALAIGLGQTALAVARRQAPAVLGNREAPVAAVLLLDTSPRMLYRFHNQTRLERAQEIARWLIRQLPADSDVAVVDARSRGSAFAVDLGAASKAVDALDVNYLPQAWKALIEQSLQLLQQNEKERKELYLLSDLTVPTWQETLDGSLIEQLRSAPDISLQVIDVGVEQPHNDALVDLQLSGQLLANGSPLEIRARVARSGPAGAGTVRVCVEPQDPSGPIVVDGRLDLPPATVRGEQPVEWDRDGSANVAFSLASLDLGTHHGYVEIAGEDGLPLDNRRYFTIHVRPPWPVLVAAPPGAVAEFLTERLAPYEFRQTGRARFECSTCDLRQINDQPLNDYAAVALLDPTPLTDDVWQKLLRYVQSGKGLAVFLGRRAGAAPQFNTTAALELLPAAIERQWRDDRGLYFAPREFDHPVLAPFRDIRSTVPWSDMPVFRHWVVGPSANGAAVILPYSNNKPALIERRLAAGSVLLLTTPISDAESSTQPSWNLLSSSLDSWPFLILLDRMFLSLVQSNDAVLNASVGQTARVPWDQPATQRLPLLTPRGDWQEVTAADGEIRVPLTDAPGAYRLKVPVASQTPRGFSANLTADTSRLNRLSVDELNQCLGPDRYRLARSEAEIVRDIDQARIGREFYPLLMPVLVLVMVMEYLLANRFYPAEA